jgi:DNA-binding MarR family transcriptional regulator
MNQVSSQPALGVDVGDTPVARLAGLAASFEISLAALRLQIAVSSGCEPADAGSLTARKLAVQIVALRQMMRRETGHTLMQDAAFDVLLHMFAMQVPDRRTGVMDVCAGLDFPETTTRRWLQRLEQVALIERFEDPHDHRRDWVILTPAIHDMLRLLLQGIAQAFSS